LYPRNLDMKDLAYTLPDLIMHGLQAKFVDYHKARIRVSSCWHT